MPNNHEYPTNQSNHDCVFNVPPSHSKEHSPSWNWFVVHFKHLQWEVYFEIIAHFFANWAEHTSTSVLIYIIHIFRLIIDSFRLPFLESVVGDIKQLLGLSGDHGDLCARRHFILEPHVSSFSIVWPKIVFPIAFSGVDPPILIHWALVSFLFQILSNQRHNCFVYFFNGWPIVPRHSF